MTAVPQIRFGKVPDQRSGDEKLPAEMNLAFQVRLPFDPKIVASTDTSQPFDLWFAGIQATASYIAAIAPVLNRYSTHETSITGEGSRWY